MSEAIVEHVRWERGQGTRLMVVISDTENDPQSANPWLLDQRVTIEPVEAGK